MAFISKAGKPSDLPKSYRPISLSSFFLKCMEKMMMHHMRDGALRLQFNLSMRGSTHTNQGSRLSLQYRTRQVSSIERNFEARKNSKDEEIMVVSFVDIEGVFNNVPFGVIYEGMRKHGIADLSIRWTKYMLENRQVTSSLMDGTVTFIPANG